MTDFMLFFLFRLFWALFLGFALTGSLKSTWNAEHGRKGPLWGFRSDNNTVVFLDPLVLPLCIVFYISLCLLFFGWEKSRGYIFSLGVDLFFFISVYFVLVLFLLPVLRTRYTARTCATFWVIPVFLFYQPTVIYNYDHLPLPVRPVFYVPRAVIYTLLLVWLGGFALLFAWQVFSHLRFSRMLKTHSHPVEDLEILAIWVRVKRDLEIGDLTRPLGLRFSPMIRTPLTIGMYRSNWITYLPERDYSEEEMELIFSHELHHIQRHDTHTKFFLGFVNALGWFHPLVWLAVKKAEEDLELSCDEIVLKDADPSTRKKYAELLLSIAGDGRGYTTCLSASAKTLCYRLKSTVSAREKRLGLPLLFLTIIISSLLMGNVNLSTDRGKMTEVTGLTSADVAEASFYPEGTDHPEAEIPLADPESVSRFLSELEMETYLTSYGEANTADTPTLYGILSEAGQSFFLTEDCLTIYEVADHKLSSRQYHVTCPPQWSRITTGPPRTGPAETRDSRK